MRDGSWGNFVSTRNRSTGLTCCQSYPNSGNISSSQLGVAPPLMGCQSAGINPRLLFRRQTEMPPRFPVGNPGNGRMRDMKRFSQIRLPFSFGQALLNLQHVLFRQLAVMMTDAVFIAAHFHPQLSLVRLTNRTAISTRARIEIRVKSMCGVSRLEVINPTLLRRKQCSFIGRYFFQDGEGKGALTIGSKGRLHCWAVMHPAPQAREVITLPMADALTGTDVNFAARYVRKRIYPRDVVDVCHAPIITHFDCHCELEYR